MLPPCRPTHKSKGATMHQSMSWVQVTQKKRSCAATGLWRREGRPKSNHAGDPLSSTSSLEERVQPARARERFPRVRIHKLSFVSRHYLCLSGLILQRYTHAGQQDELVALIPYNDKRLRPRRTWVRRLLMGSCLNQFLWNVIYISQLCPMSACHWSESACESSLSCRLQCHGLDWIVTVHPK